MHDGFGKGRKPASVAPGPRAKPLKRPTQARARFTVEAIYEAFVRICRRDGWAGVTTRAVALEAGVAVGTLYDYFPSKEALLSGYVRHCLESLAARIDSEVIAPPLDWRERVRRLLDLGAGLGMPLVDGELLQLEQLIAEPKHHQRVYEELAGKWREALQACVDLPRPVDADTAEALFMAAWGGWRYALLLELDAPRRRRWQAQLEQLYLARLGGQGSG
ncbi:TetR/AcrR family transcriptional regulator [Pseudomonas citronellolis]|uniref:TetR/AcrR family transcriptional regulator n=1 Tax=Pseudomonas citronellolis TaxID=53408 RepID=UPI0023E3B18C|nr:TetR/AcrR family transcriptional regulator [Pseudomonas citronellolis]MDF3934758.1 TetR/AcrR family transcriptional regulator [Pseudomonas citronellolis]